MPATDFTEILVGYDARIVWEEQTPADAEDVRTRRRIAEPLSVETLTWPSVFDTGEGYAMDMETRHRFRMTGIPTPKWTGPIGRTWDSLERLRAYLDEQRVAETQSYQIIGISAFRENEYAADWYLTRWQIAITPAQHDPAWNLLGYDIADYSLYSSLAGYLLDREESDRWRALLNAHGLFTDIERAAGFREFAEEIYPTEPDPPEIFGLYLIETVPQSSRT
jgi:hypothetical protein